MDNYPIKKLAYQYWPPQLTEIYDKPKELFYRGNIPDSEQKFLCIVGSRKFTEYGAEVCQKLIEGLKNFPITIVSGLAFGIDALAHKYAIENNLNTIAFPASGLEEKNIYPKNNFQLAVKILENGGSLISEFNNKIEIQKWVFPQRNRLMAGISDAVLVIEAGQKSGTMITSRLALDYNRNVLAVPGSIFNLNSVSTNNLIKDGAIPITNSQDILWALGFNEEEINLFTELEQKKNLKNMEKYLSNLEKNILEILKTPFNIDQIAQKINAPINEVAVAVSNLEIKNLIRDSGGVFIKN